ncbi:DUF4157 domain-containing protein [Saccharopolyspora sp. ID03-671]|uniref:eCIS core domain-containing protein n=1 Tax=Saccharopolyspora sp. ID03-671 TaxID=3073066 RepID=UPI00324C86DD
MREQEPCPEHRVNRPSRPARTPAEPAARGVAAGGRLTPAGVLALQRLVGNDSVVRTLGHEVQRSAVHQALRSPGQPLDAEVAANMGTRLGADFSDVRVHTDTAAHEAAESVRAHAFTSGSHIVFQRGRYDTSSPAGERMLAHELAHVIQQRSGPVPGTETPDGLKVSDPADRFEREADATAARAMSSGAAPSRPIPRNGAPRDVGSTVQRMDEVREEPEGPSVVVDFPRPKRNWSQIFVPGNTPEWTELVAVVERHHPHITDDPQVIFNHEKQSVLVKYHPRALHDAYPSLSTHLVGSFGTVGRLEERGRQSARTRRYWSQQDARDETLEREAVTEARNFAGGAAVNHPLAGRTGLMPGEALRALLTNPDADGFVIGEKHDEEYAWNFLAANLNAAKAAGLRTIYLEQIRRGDAQGWVDEHLGSAQDAPMPPQLDVFCRAYQDRWHHDGLRTVLNAAKAVGGITIQGVDAIPARKRRVLGTEQEVAEAWSAHTRAARMNTFAADVVRQDQARTPSKYVILIGRAHAGHHSFTGDRTKLIDEPTHLVGDGDAKPGLPDVVPGVADYLGLPAVEISSPSDAWDWINPIDLSASSARRFTGDERHPRTGHPTGNP